MSSEGELPPLYKYRSLQGTGPKSPKELLRATIIGNAIWFSKPEDFNDPFDCAPGFSMEAPKAKFQDYMIQLMREKSPQLNRQARAAQMIKVRRDLPALFARIQEQTWRTMNEAGVLSLSTKRDDILMWSHYGASHTGVCLRFSRAKWAFPFWAAQPVVYSEERPILNPVLDDGNTVLTKTVLTKAIGWEYEAEWRVMSYLDSPDHPGRGHGLRAFHPDALDGIIFGARASEADIAEVRRWVERRQKQVELLRARADRNHFRLHIEPLEVAG